MNSRPVLLLVDDDAEIREQLKSALAPDYEVLEAVDRQVAVAHVRKDQPDVILLDLELPPDTGGALEGLALLHEVIRLSPRTKVIVLTANSDRANAVASIEGGAHDFIEKPVRLDVLKIVLERATYLIRLEQDRHMLQAENTVDEFEGLIGRSSCIHDVVRMIRRVGPTDVPVLIAGESGTGKELVARAIHSQSLRNSGPFVAINCGAIPETLLESELFGYEKGAFTGALQQRKGRIESAQGGTLFLDEVGDIPLGLQVKLLRFLQDRTIQRLGAKESITVDTRILAATNVDLQLAINEGGFREDLYYRLCVITITVPSLRERGSDIALLAKTFLLKCAKEHNKTLLGFTPQANEALARYHWPGNVRELQNRVKRSVLMAEEKYVTAANLELEVASGAGEEGGTLRAFRERSEKDLVRIVLDKCSGNISRAAAQLGVSRPTLYQLLHRYGLKRPKFDGVRGRV